VPKNKDTFDEKLETMKINSDHDNTHSYNYFPNADDPPSQYYTYNYNMDVNMATENINYAYPYQSFIPGQYDFGMVPQIPILENPSKILTEIPENWFEFPNNGHDLPNGDYIIRKDDIIISPEGTEYQIEELIGRGTFGQVIKWK